MLNAERGDCASVAKIIEQSQGEQKELKKTKTRYHHALIHFGKFYNTKLDARAGLIQDSVIQSFSRNVINMFL